MPQSGAALACPSCRYCIAWFPGSNSAYEEQALLLLRDALMTVEKLNVCYLAHEEDRPLVYLDRPRRKGSEG